MAQSTNPLPLIDLNTANKETLITLPGINEELAEKIINFREKVQPFEAPIEVVAIRGISEEMYRGFADAVTVSTAQESSGKDADEPQAEGAPVQADPVPQKQDVDEQAKTEEKAAKTDDATAEDSAEKNQESNSQAQTQTDEPQPQATELVKSQEDGYKIIWPDEETEIVTGRDDTEPKTSQPSEAKSFRRSWLLMVVGALLGTLISLGLLYAINDGTLIINRHPAVLELNRKLTAMEQQETTLRNEVTTLRNKLNEYSTLDTRLLNAENSMKVMQQTQQDLAGQIEAVEQRASVVEERAATLENRATKLETSVTTLQDESAQMQETLTKIESDTNRFNQFLTGLAELLSSTTDETPSNQ